MFTQDNLRNITRAATYAAHKHRNQRRKVDDIPYINHPLDVGSLVASYMPHPSLFGEKEEMVHTIMAAYLHDVVEDTGTSKQQIADAFGNTVADIVMEVTDDKSLPKVERKKQQIIHAGQISRAAQYIKLADKYSNLNDLLTSTPKGWTQEDVQGYCVWSYQVVQALNKTKDSSLRSLINILFANLCARLGFEFGLYTDPAALQRYYDWIAKSK
jgi:guanosine-3',5'-bis(diphosphate) 3'-pyrophosphohydrolase